ncbi:4-hydroxy-3-methylbut-2-enyl diphosphate reductase [Micromonospora humi]|uniref:4-hydroxy-3-methylbut-2-enyl diphosphate reductase n=1 Tax=Micromonospora humi TaxID=745366 RepID=A0A1C5K9U8_9ACTN|nr:4-hydroxy-3-methylbut-2-enyl diphosphate reductase [Micromonospora humi]SCG79522.1 4-hydroxy-3-methylbut-2-enyl diphosphate reductase [Micromonospora humi]
MDIGEKKVLLANPRGYCAGVERAVQTVEKALELYGPPIYVRKEIVHNRHVVQALTAKGVRFVEENEEVPEGATVIFSAHGVAPDVHTSAAARSLRVIDATCPLVTKVHNEVRRFAAEGYDILLIGHQGHEEVLGTAGEAPAQIQVVDTPEDVDSVTVRDPERVVWLSQTTLSVDETQQTVGRLRARFPALKSPPSDDICYATQNRQEAVKAMAPACDVIIVVGSPNSSNSQRLREVALEAGAGAAYLVDFAHEIAEEWLGDARTVGLTAGASVPNELVEDALGWLRERGFSTVEPVTTAVENIVFALPQELRAALRPAPGRDS